MKKMNRKMSSALAGGVAGFINGLFGAGGGMVLVPLLEILTDIDEGEVFPTSVSIILPICITSLLVGGDINNISISHALPYLLGGAIGGILAVRVSKHIPTRWLHLGFGILILIGGIRNLC